MDRAERLQAYMGETGETRNAERLRALFTSLAQRLSFEAFRELTESELFGLVVTAHPTFSTSTGLLHLMNRLATGTMDDIAEARRHAGTTIHRPDASLTLDAEHALSVEALTNMRGAVATATQVLLEAAASAWPEKWRTLRPRPLTMASWVGYDLDGRSDISFADMLAKRAILQARQIALVTAKDLEAIEPRRSRKRASQASCANLRHGPMRRQRRKSPADIDVFAHFRGEDTPKASKAVRTVVEAPQPRPDRAVVTAGHS